MLRSRVSERRKILELFAAKQLSVEQADELLAALELGNQESHKESYGAPKAGYRSVRISIKSRKGENVNLKLPLTLAKFIGKMIPPDAKVQLEDQGIELQELIASLGEQPGEGRIADIQTGKGDSIVIEVV